MDATWFTMICGFGGLVCFMLVLLLGAIGKEKPCAIAAVCAVPLLSAFILSPLFVEYRGMNKLSTVRDSLVAGFNDKGRITAVNDGPVFCWNRCTTMYREADAASAAVLPGRHIAYLARIRVVDMQKFFDYRGPGANAVKNNDFGSMSKNILALQKRARWWLDEFGHAKTLELATFNDPLNAAQRAGLENLLMAYLNTPERLGKYGMEVAKLLDLSFTVE